MIKKKKTYSLGIDLGGSKTEGVVLDKDLKVLFRKRIPTVKDKGYDQIIKDIVWLYEEMAEVAEGNPYTFGIGTPGSISRKTGLMKNSNITFMNGRPFIQDLEHALNRKIGWQNDSNCFVLAEAIFGAGKGKKRVFGAILGTGIGGGMIYEGKLIDGHQMLAGEWGHSIISSYGHPCHCGKIGCIETYISGSGVERKYSEMYGEKLAMPEIVKRYRHGEENARIIMSEFFLYFGKAVSNLIAILDPDIIILGGGLSNIDELYTIGVNKVRDFVFNDELATPIVRNKCGDSAGVLGAALIGV
jgi:fructokinase